jgi:hypothetical protein
MNTAACWEQVERAFARLLRAQRLGTVEEVVLYAADLTSPLGLALARAVHEAKLGPDPALFDGRCAITMSVMTLNATVRVTSAEPAIAGALEELRRLAPAPHHVRALLVAERADVIELPLSRLLRAEP